MDGEKLVKSLRPLVSSTCKFSTPTAKEADIGVTRWTDWKAPSFVATVKPTTVQDVQAVVKYASDNDIPFLAVGSGHGYSASFGRARDALEIDINNFKDIAIDVENSTVTIGGAVLHREIIPPLWQVGKQIRKQDSLVSAGLL